MLEPILIFTKARLYFYYIENIWFEGILRRLVYLKGRKTKSSLLFHPLKCLQQPGLGQNNARRLEFHLGLPGDIRDPNIYATIHCIYRVSNGKQRSEVSNQHSDVGCGHPTQWLSVLYHNTCLFEAFWKSNVMKSTHEQNPQNETTEKSNAYAFSFGKLQYHIFSSKVTI